MFYAYTRPRYQVGVYRIVYYMNKLCAIIMILSFRTDVSRILSFRTDVSRENSADPDQTTQDIHCLPFYLNLLLAYIPYHRYSKF